MRLVVWKGMALALCGVAAGLAGAFGLSRLMQSLLFGVRPDDPLTSVTIALMLMLITFMASYTPIEARTGDHNFRSADEQGKEAQGRNPVSDADEGRVPRRSRLCWDGDRDGRDSTWNASGVAHAGMVRCI